MANSERELAKLNEELNNIMRQLNDANTDSRETRHEQKRQEALENLKRVFSDRIYGRLVDLCKPSQNKFDVAVTKVKLWYRSIFKIALDSPKTHEFNCLWHSWNRMYGYQILAWATLFYWNVFASWISWCSSD